MEIKVKVKIKLTQMKFNKVDRYNKGSNNFQLIVIILI